MTSRLIGWQYRPLTVEQKAERDALLRIILRSMQLLAEKRLIPCTNFACEQRLEIRRPTVTPGVFQYAEYKTMEPDPTWGLARRGGQWSVECAVRVDQAERIRLEDSGVTGYMLMRLFAEELRTWHPDQYPQMLVHNLGIAHPASSPETPSTSTVTPAPRVNGKRPVRWSPPPTQQSLWTLLPM